MTDNCKSHPILDRPIEELKTEELLERFEKAFALNPAKLDEVTREWGKRHGLTERKAIMDSFHESYGARVRKYWNIP